MKLDGDEVPGGRETDNFGQHFQSIYSEILSKYNIAFENKSIYNPSNVLKISEVNFDCAVKNLKSKNLVLIKSFYVLLKFAQVIRDSHCCLFLI